MDNFGFPWEWKHSHVRKWAKTQFDRAENVGMDLSRLVITCHINPGCALFGWHITANRKLRGGTDLEEGRIYYTDGPLEMCEHGLHFSLDIKDALLYMPSSTTKNSYQLSRVAGYHKTFVGANKVVSEKRKVLWSLDLTPFLFDKRLQNCPPNEIPKKARENGLITFPEKPRELEPLIYVPNPMWYIKSREGGF